MCVCVCVCVLHVRIQLATPLKIVTGCCRMSWGLNPVLTVFPLWK